MIYKLEDITNKVLQGDSLNILKQYPDECIDMCVSSPPYFNLRDYQNENQIGLEKTPEEFIEKLVLVFREVRRVLKPWGTLWVNMGDSYYGSGKGQTKTGCNDVKQPKLSGMKLPVHNFSSNLKPKDLIGIPWMLAFALRNDGWYLRQDIIWSKPSAMPESVQDRCTKSHEYIFLLSKSNKYYYDNTAIKEKCTSIDLITRNRDFTKLNNTPGRSPMKGLKTNNYNLKNKRSVWNVVTTPFHEAHFAVFPEELVKPMILAGTSEKGVCSKCGKPYVRNVETGDLKNIVEVRKNTLNIIPGRDKLTRLNSKKNGNQTHLGSNLCL
jgi:DNA modification methylase